MNTHCNALVVPARLAHPVHIKAVELGHDSTSMSRKPSTAPRCSKATDVRVKRPTCPAT
ncbi:hypothetical protein QFZ23_002149 [Arthrobacter globiformis]|nr:hypothetical protein [Arthrobacter globiformis]